MHIKSIELTNFRSFAGAVVDLPSRVTFIIGRNHSGKSTLIDALTWALVGRCRGTAADGKGSDVLIRDASGVSAMKVAVSIDPSEGPAMDRLKPFTVERMQNARTSTFAVAGVVGTRQDASTALEDRLGASPVVIEACLNSDAFLDLHHATAKSLLLDLLNVQVPVEGETLTLAELDQRYEHWYRERPMRKKALDAIRLPEKPADGDVPDLTALEAKLQRLREEEKALIAEASEESGRRIELDRQIAHATSEQTRLSAKLSSLSTAAGVDGATVDLDDAIAELEERLATTALTDGEREEADQARLALVDAGGRLRVLTDTIAAVKAHAPDRGCVLNPAIECRTPAKSFEKELKAITQQLAELKAQQDEASKAVETARLRQADADTRERRLIALKHQAASRDAVTGDLATLTDTLTKLTFERDQTAEATSAVNPQRLQLQDRILKGETVVKDVQHEIHQRKVYAAAKLAQEDAARALADTERKVDLYGPKGARVAALETALADFHGRINVALSRFGYTLRIVADPWLVLVNDRPAALLSKSERLQAGLALQLAIADVSGVGFVAIDQVDLFDAENRRAFGALLDATPVQVLAAMTRDDSFEPPTVDGWTWVRLTQVDGVSQVVPCGEAVLA
jgi:DNA repair exonuclease SbcCD ATPase subunit